MCNYCWDPPKWMCRHMMASQSPVFRLPVISIDCFLNSVRCNHVTWLRLRWDMPTLSHMLLLISAYLDYKCIKPSHKCIHLYIRLYSITLLWFNIRLLCETLAKCSARLTSMTPDRYCKTLLYIITLRWYFKGALLPHQHVTVIKLLKSNINQIE